MSSFQDFDATCFTYDQEATNLYGRDYWRVTKSFTFYYNDGENTLAVKPPIGFLFSGRTIPTEYFHVASPVGQYPQLSAMHEYLCEYGVTWLGRNKVIVSKEKALQMLVVATFVLKAGSESRKMVTIIRGSQFASGVAEPIDAMKNNLDHKWHGKEALNHIRNLLSKTTTT